MDNPFYKAARKFDDRYREHSPKAAKIFLAKDEDKLAMIYQYVKTNSINRTTFTKMINDFIVKGDNNGNA